MKLINILKNKLVLIALVLLLVLAAGYRIYLKNFAIGGFGGFGGGMPPAMAEGTKVKQIDWIDQISATGTIKARQGVDLHSQVGGQVKKILFQAGNHVAKNTQLIQLDIDVLQAQINQARAQAWLDSTNNQREQELYEKQVAAAMERDQARANLQVSRAKVAELKAELAKRIVQAPFAGDVGLPLVEEGQYVNIDTPLVSLQTLDPLRIDFQVPEIYIGRLKPNLSVDITTSAYPNQTFKGKVYAIDTRVEESTRSVMMRAEIPNSERKLKPGMFGEVMLTLAGHVPTLVIPQVAVAYDVEGPYVFVVRQGVAHKVKIKLGQRRDADVAILSGLHEDDLIVTAGQIKLQDKAKVIIK